MDNREMLDVRAFNARHNLLVNDAPTHVTKIKLNNQFKIMREKFRLVADAAHEQDMVEQAQTLVELVYSVKSVAVMLGLPWRALWDNTHLIMMAWPLPVESAYVERTAEILQQAGYDRAAFTHPSAPDVIDERFCDDDRATRLVP